MGVCGTHLEAVQVSWGPSGRKLIPGLGNSKLSSGSSSGERHLFAAMTPSPGLCSSRSGGWVGELKTVKERLT